MQFRSQHQMLRNQVSSKLASVRPEPANRTMLGGDQLSRWVESRTVDGLGFAHRFYDFGLEGPEIKRRTAEHDVVVVEGKVTTRISVSDPAWRDWVVCIECSAAPDVMFGSGGVVFIRFPDRLVDERIRDARLCVRLFLSAGDCYITQQESVRLQVVVKYVAKELSDSTSGGSCR